MASISYPFIDLAVLDGVREHLAGGHAVLVLSENLDAALLANFAGAQLAGFEGPFDLAGENPELGASAIRQIRALDIGGNPGKAASIGLRLAGGIESRLTMMTVNSAVLPGGEAAIVLSCPAPSILPEASLEAPSRGTENRAADAIIHGMADDTTHFAVLDKTGLVLSASGQFAALQLSDFDLAQLATQAQHETDRMVKRRLKSGANFIPVGIGRLRDEPALFILLAIAELGPVQTEEQPGGAVRLSGPDVAMVETVLPTPLEALIQHDAIDNAHGGDTFDEGNADSDLQSVSGLQVDVASQPVRFTWKIGADGKFSSVSLELGDAIGKQAAEVIGRSFQEVANVFAFDHGGEIAGLLARRDTWSGRSVLWPVEGTDMRVPVDLAALPVYDRERNFEGFRGFGIVRLGDAVIDPERLGLALVKKLEIIEAREDVSGDEDDWRGEVPAITISAPAKHVFQNDDKIVQLGEHRLQKDKLEEATEKSGLTPIERSAFREIADRLRGDNAAPDGKTPTPLAFEDLLSAAPESDFVYPDSTGGDRSIENLSWTGPSKDNFLSSDNDPDYRLPFNPDETSGRENGSDAAPILSKLPVPVLIHNGANLLYGNPAFFELTLYASLEALEEEGGIEHLLHVSSSGENTASSSKILLADNNEKPVRAHLHSVRWKGEHALLLSLRPLEEEAETSTQSVQTIDKLRREVSELSSVLETATDGVVFVHGDGTIRSINQSAEALFGFDPVSVAGKPFTHLLATESQKAANDYIANLAGTGVASLINDGREVIGREAHGRFIPLFMTIGRLEADTGYCVVLRDITQWKRAEEELNASKRAAEHASTQKSEFLARVSHEIRTPLNAIIGFSDMMTEERFGPVGNPRYLDYLGDINRSGKHVLDLVNDLLDISKIEAGQQEMNFESVALNEALAEAVSIMQPQANRERVIIRSSFATELPEVVADVRSIKQIALNLLANAVRYTGAGGQVIVSTSYELTGGVAIRVRDTGVGMSAQDIEQALKPFKQINTLKRERGDGTGLGLPLTKAMVEANRASFIISSTPGQGTLIEITFPSTRVLAD
jgi:PAS domain S-box-containing protein